VELHSDTNNYFLIHQTTLGGKSMKKQTWSRLCALMLAVAMVVTSLPFINVQANEPPAASQQVLRGNLQGSGALVWQTTSGTSPAAIGVSENHIFTVEAKGTGAVTLEVHSDGVFYDAMEIEIDSPDWRTFMLVSALPLGEEYTVVIADDVQAGGAIFVRSVSLVQEGSNDNLLATPNFANGMGAWQTSDADVWQLYLLENNAPVVEAAFAPADASIDAVVLRGELTGSGDHVIQWVNTGGHEHDFAFRVEARGVGTIGLQWAHPWLSTPVRENFAIDSPDDWVWIGPLVYTNWWGGTYDGWAPLSIIDAGILGETVYIRTVEVLRTNYHDTGTNRFRTPTFDGPDAPQDGPGPGYWNLGPAGDTWEIITIGDGSGNNGGDNGELVLRGELTGGGSHVFQATLPGGGWGWDRAFDLVLEVRGTGVLEIETRTHYGDGPDTMTVVNVDYDDWTMVTHSSRAWAELSRGVVIRDGGAGTVYIRSASLIVDTWGATERLLHTDFTADQLTHNASLVSWGRTENGWYTSDPTVWSIVEFAGGDNGPVLTEQTVAFIEPTNDDWSQISRAHDFPSMTNRAGSLHLQEGARYQLVVQYRSTDFFTIYMNPTHDWDDGIFGFGTIDACQNITDNIAHLWGGTADQFGIRLPLTNDEWAVERFEFTANDITQVDFQIYARNALGTGEVAINYIGLYRVGNARTVSSNYLVNGDFEGGNDPVYSQLFANWSGSGSAGNGNHGGWQLQQEYAPPIPTIDDGGDNGALVESTVVIGNVGNGGGGDHQIAREHVQHDGTAGRLYLEQDARYRVEIQYRSTAPFAIHMNRAGHWPDGIFNGGYATDPCANTQAHLQSIWGNQMIQLQSSDDEWVTERFEFTASIWYAGLNRNAIHFFIYDILNTAGPADRVIINYVALVRIDAQGEVIGTNYFENGDFELGFNNATNSFHYWAGRGANGQGGHGVWRLATMDAPVVPEWARSDGDPGNGGNGPDPSDRFRLPPVPRFDQLAEHDSLPLPAIVPPQDPSNPPELGIYLWDRNPTGAIGFEQWVGGTPVTIVDDFQPFYGSWEHMISDARAPWWTDWVNDQSSWVGGQPTRRVAIAFPVFPADRDNWVPDAGGWDGARGATQRALDQFRQAAAGDFNHYYREFGEMLVHYGLGNSIIRFGHEFDGNWYAWSISVGPGGNTERPGLYAEAFRQLVNTLRDIDGQNFTFSWNPNAAFITNPQILRDAFPGPEYVDYISFDQYDQFYGGTIYNQQYHDANPTFRRERQQQVWNHLYNHPTGFAWFRDFSNEMGVPLTIGEWGLWWPQAPGHIHRGGGDNAYFIRQMHNFINSANVAWHVYFNFGDVSHSIWDLHRHPMASREFLHLWNPQGAPAYYPFGWYQGLDWHEVPRHVPPAIWPGDIATPVGQGQYVLFARDAEFIGYAGPQSDPWSLSGVLADIWREPADGGSAIFFEAPYDSTGFALVYQPWVQNINHAQGGNDRFVTVQIDGVPLINPNPEAGLDPYVFRLPSNGIMWDNPNPVTNRPHSHNYRYEGRGWIDSYAYIIFPDIQVAAGDEISFHIPAGVHHDMLWAGVKFDYIVLFTDNPLENNMPAAYPSHIWPAMWQGWNPVLAPSLHRPGSWVPNRSDWPDEPTLPIGQFPPTRVTNAMSGWQALHDSRMWRFHNLIAGRSYIFSGWVKGLGDEATTNMSFNLQETGGWVRYGGANISIPNNGEWHFVTGTVTANHTGEHQLGFEGAVNAEGGVNALFDNVTFRDTVTGDYLVFADMDARFPGGWGGIRLDFGVANNPYVRNQDWAMRVGTTAEYAIYQLDLALEEDAEYTFAIFARGAAGDSFTVEISDGNETFEETFTVSTAWEEFEFNFTPTADGDFTLRIIDFNLNAPLFLDCLLLYAEGTNNLIRNMDFERGNLYWTLSAGTEIINFSEPDLGPDAIHDNFSDTTMSERTMNNVEIVNTLGVPINLLPDPTFANTTDAFTGWFGYWDVNRANWTVVDLGAGNFAIRADLDSFNDAWDELMTNVNVIAGRTYRIGVRASGTGNMTSYIMQSSPGTYPAVELTNSRIAVNPSGPAQVFETTFTSNHTGQVGFTMQRPGGAGTGVVYIEEIWLYLLPPEDAAVLERSVPTGVANVVYEINPSYNIRNISIEAVLAESIDPADAFTFEISNDGGITWLPLPIAEVYLLGETLVYEFRTGLPTGNQLRINFEEVTDTADIRITEVFINARVAPVYADVVGMGETLQYAGYVYVELSTLDSNATIMFSIDGGAAQLYSGPIRITGHNTIVAWAAEFPLINSFASTFRFFNTDTVRVDRLGQIVAAAGNFDTWLDPDDEASWQAAWDDDDLWLSQFSRPAEWDVWGGLAGSGADFGFAATGFFRIENYTWPDGRVQSFMLTPLGNIYFNNAPNTVNTFESFTVVQGREEVYAWLPDDPAFNSAWGYSNVHGRTFSFYGANWIRRHGGTFNSAAFADVQGQRLLDLGFTGAGGWSLVGIHPQLPEFGWLHMPSYTISSSHLWDAFHPNFETQMQTRFAGLVANANNPNIIGYFMDNERYYDHLRVRILEAGGASSGTRARLGEVLEERYGTIAAFNTAWDLELANWSAFTSGAIPLNTNQASSDMDDFYHIYFDHLYARTAYWFNQFAPNQLLLGSRLHSRVMQNTTLADIIITAIGPHLDAISWNYYAWDVNLDLIARYYALGGNTPFIMTEFHYGDISTGLTFGVRMAENEYEKGSMFRNYVEKMAYSGHVVGVNWFTWLDQAPTGRYFEGLGGEAGAIGFFNVADRPYRILLEHVTETNFRIYDLVLRNEQPHQHPFREGQVDREGQQNLLIPRIEGGMDIHDLSTPWEGAATAVLGPLNIVEGVLTHDVGAEYFLAWDGDYLYLRADITQPWPMLSGAAYAGTHHHDWHPWTWVWAGDAVELFFGPENVDDGGGMHRTDVQLLFGAHRNDSDPANPHTINAWYNRGQRLGPAATNWGAMTNTASPDGLLVMDIGARLWDDETGYSIAARIPLSEITGREPEAGETLRFDMGFSAGAQANGDRTHQLMWNGTGFNSSSRERWGTIELVDELPILVTDVTIEEGDTTLEEGETIQLTAVIAPADATNQNVTWESSNPGVAEVDPVTGLVTAIAPGTAIITVTTEDGDHEYSITITIEAYTPTPVTGVTIQGGNFEINVGATRQLVAVITPVGATNQNVIWESANANIARVHPTTGLLTAVTPGVVVVTVTTEDGDVTASITVTVRRAPAPPEDTPIRPRPTDPVDPPAADPVIDETVIITAPEQEDSLETGEDVVIDLGYVVVTFPEDVIDNWVNEDGEPEDVYVTIVLDQTNLPANISIDLSREDDTPVEVGDTPITVEVNITGVDTSEVNYHRIVAVLEDGTLVGGSYDPETGVFTFETTVTGNFTINYFEDLQRIHMNINSMVVTDLTQERTVAMDVAPILQNGRTLVPLRFVAETLGASVYWNEATYEVTMILDGEVLVFAIGEYLPGMDVPAQLISGRTYVPLRFVVEYFNALVFWNGETGDIEILRMITRKEDEE